MAAGTHLNMVRTDFVKIDPLAPYDPISPLMQNNFFLKNTQYPIPKIGVLNFQESLKSVWRNLCYLDYFSSLKQTWLRYICSHFNLWIILHYLFKDKIFKFYLYLSEHLCNFFSFGIKQNGCVDDYWLQNKQNPENMVRTNPHVLIRSGGPAFSK